MSVLSTGRKTAWRTTVGAVVRRSARLRDESDEALAGRARELSWRAKTGEPLRRLLVESFALTRETARRTLGMTHYPVQILGGIALMRGHVAEMQTGEGKTLTATLPVALHALAGRGAHVVTTNDYLAARDAETLRPVYETLGLSVGCVTADMEPDQRRDAYAKDVTYGTAKEFGFDFLRDRLKTGADGKAVPRSRLLGGPTSVPAGGDGKEAPVQRGHHFALVDEADSLLIDEARTPLIIGLTRPNDPATVSLYRWADGVAGRIERDEDYLYEPDHRIAQLTRIGCRRVLLMPKPSLIDTVDAERMYVAVEKALVTRLGFARDRDYVVRGGKVAIVDESTGRVMEGRKWQDGMHQAVEARERVPITAATGQAARVTVQSFFSEYEHLAGMTGTARQSAGEFRKAYRLPVTPIPTHRRGRRTGLPPRIFRTAARKREAVADAVAAARDAGRPVLVGTPSVAASDALAALLLARRIPCAVLNAREHEKEADVVAAAGRGRAVTLATNMAGRGTDIEPDEAAVKAGGLHVIATEMHSSARIDRQLIGRAARQGDPGSYQFFLSLEDELLRCRPPHVRRRWLNAAPNGELPRAWLRVFRDAQRFLEKLHRKQRKDLLKQEKERDETYRKIGLDPCLELTE